MDIATVCILLFILCAPSFGELAGSNGSWPTNEIYGNVYLFMTALNWEEKRSMLIN